MTEPQNFVRTSLDVYRGSGQYIYVEVGTLFYHHVNTDAATLKIPGDSV